jgi:trehalose 6-phosphate phosphatase
LTSVSLPRALDNLSDIGTTIGGRTPAFFLDFDGTIAPLSARPDLAELPKNVSELLVSLAEDHVVCIVSGRDLADLRRKVGLSAAYYAGDHGYRVSGPAGSGIELEVGGSQDRMELETASYELERRLHPIDGVLVETKGASLSVHYRLVGESMRPLVHQIVREVAASVPGLELTAGKLVHELRPRLPWDKGRAVLWLLGQLRLRRDEVCPVTLGDDLTDEDMYTAVRRWGVSVIVGEPSWTTRADYLVASPGEAVEFLQTFVTREGCKPPPPV